MKKSKSIECNICHLKLQNTNFDRHMETHGKRECKECNQRFDSQEKLDEHKKVHLCCPQCPELGPFHDTANLNRHKREKHLEIPRHRQNCFLKFQNEVKYGPIFTCISCHRCLYENGVIICKEEHMKQFEKVLKEADHQETFERFKKHMYCKFALDKDFSGNGVLYICHNCKNKVNNGHMPAMCFANNLLLESQPKCLSTLSEVESTLIATNIQFQKLFLLPKTRWSAIKDKVINVPIPKETVQNTIRSLPNFPKDYSHFRRP